MIGYGELLRWLVVLLCMDEIDVFCSEVNVVFGRFELSVVVLK